MDLIKIFPLPPTPTSQMFLPILISSGTWNCWLFSVGFWDVNIYIKYVFISESSVNYWWISISRKNCVCISFLISLESVLMCFWKIRTGNNCNFATDLDPDLFRSCLFSAVPAMLRRISSHRLEFPADVQTSGDFLCCQILRCLLYPSVSHLLALRWL